MILLAAASWSKSHGYSGGVGSIVVRQVQTCDSRAFFRLQRWCSNVQSKFVCTRRQVTPQGETRHDLGYGRRDVSRRQVPGLAAKTEEDERRRTGKRITVDLTLNETF